MIKVIAPAMLLVCSCFALITVSCQQLNLGKVEYREIPSSIDTIKFRGVHIHGVPDALLLALADSIGGRRRAEFAYVLNPVQSEERGNGCVGLFQVVVDKWTSHRAVGKVLVFEGQVYVWDKKKPEKNKRMLSEFIARYYQRFSDRELSLVQQEFMKGTNHYGGSR